jgi:hypothetical protein
MSTSNISFVTVSDDRYGRKDGKYSSTQDFILETLRSNSHMGFSNFFFWKFNDILSTDFYKENKKMLDNHDPAMNGRCYKPFTILEALKSIGDGDFLIYNDVSPEHWTNLSFDSSVFSLDVIKELCNSNGGILSTESVWMVNNEVAPHTHENFTTESCMNRMDMQKYRHSIQHASGMIVFQKSKKTLDFVSEWLKWNLIDECASLSSLDEPIRDFYGVDVGNCGKVGHRHDQSISGLLINDLNGKIVKNPGGFNFLNFCRRNFGYDFIETNQGPSDYIYWNTFDGSNWVYLKSPRNPENIVRVTSDPTNLR